MNELKESIYTSNWEKAKELIKKDEVTIEDKNNIVISIIEEIKPKPFGMSSDIYVENPLESIKFLIQNGADINISWNNRKLSNDIDFFRTMIEEEDNEEDNNLLMHLINSGEYSPRHLLIAFLIEKKVNLNARGYMGNTALIYAMQLNAYVIKDYEIAKLLIKNGADVTLKNNNKETALMHFPLHNFNSFGWSEEYNNLLNATKNIISFFIDKGVDINDSNINGTTILMKYVTVDSKLTKFLIDKGADIQAKDNQDETALIYALKESNSVYYVQLLLEHGADINIKTKDAMTPLMFASKKGDSEVVKLLLEKGAKIDDKDNNGETAFIKNLKSTIFQSSYFIKNLKSTIFQSSYGLTNENIINILNIFLNNNADINIKDNNGNTAFMIAVQNNLAVPIKILIRKGIDISKEDIDINALFINSLFHNDNFWLSEYLLKNGVDINYKDEEDNSFLLLVINKMGRTINRNIIEYLIYRDKGVSINSQNKFGFTPLMRLIIGIDYKSDIKFYTEYTKFSEQSIIPYLVSQGANINTTSKRDTLITPLTLAIMHKKEHTYQYLMDLKVDTSNALKYLLKNDLYFEKEYFNKLLNDFLPNKIDDIDYFTRLSLLESWSYFDKRIDVDKIDKCRFLLDKLKIRIGRHRDSYDYGVNLLILPKDGLDNVKKALKNNLHSIDSITFEDVLGEFIEFPKKAKELVKILTNFRKDTPIKYTTHLWDMNFKKEYGNFDGYIVKVQEEWEKIETNLKSLSPRLHSKIYNFIFNSDEKCERWCSKSGDDICIGWSSLQGLREWCNEGNDPFSFKLEKIYTIENKTISSFGDVINLFKQEIQIRNENNMLEKLFIDIEEKLDNEFEDVFEIETIKLKGKSFYTDVEAFESVIDRIFSEIKKRQKFTKIRVEVVEEDDEDYMDLKIMQIGSESHISSKDMLTLADGGDSKEIKKDLTNLCDWSIESSYEDEYYRINYLRGASVSEVEPLREKPEGFTHIMRFYR